MVFFGCQHLKLTDYQILNKIARKPSNILEVAKRFEFAYSATVYRINKLEKLGLVETSCEKFGARVSRLTVAGLMVVLSKSKLKEVVGLIENYGDMVKMLNKCLTLVRGEVLLDFSKAVQLAAGTVETRIPISDASTLKRRLALLKYAFYDAFLALAFPQLKLPISRYSLEYVRPRDYHEEDFKNLGEVLLSFEGMKRILRGHIALLTHLHFTYLSTQLTPSYLLGEEVKELTNIIIDRVSELNKQTRKLMEELNVSEDDPSWMDKAIQMDSI